VDLNDLRAASAKRFPRRATLGDWASAAALWVLTIGALVTLYLLRFSTLRGHGLWPVARWMIGTFLVWILFAGWRPFSRRLKALKDDEELEPTRDRRW